MKENLKKNVAITGAQQFLEEKDNMESRLSVGHDGSTVAGGIITLSLGFMLSFVFFYRMYYIYATNEYAYDVRESFYTND
jgi:hypothetical protein